MVGMKIAGPALRSCFARAERQSSIMRLGWILLTSFMMTAPGYSGSRDELTLCEPSETVVFSCVSSRQGTDPFHSTLVTRKVISLCATPVLQADFGALIYRFGADKRHVELTYPAPAIAPDKSFTAVFESFAKASHSRLAFNVGDYSYTLYNQVAVYEEHPRSNGGGVLVTREGKLVSDRWCDGKEHSADIQDRIWEIVAPLKLPKTE